MYIQRLHSLHLQDKQVPPTRQTSSAESASRRASTSASSVQTHRPLTGTISQKQHAARIRTVPRLATLPGHVPDHTRTRTMLSHSAPSKSLSAEILPMSRLRTTLTPRNSLPFQTFLRARRALSRSNLSATHQVSERSLLVA